MRAYGKVTGVMHFDQEFYHPHPHPPDNCSLVFIFTKWTEYSSLKIQINVVTIMYRPSFSIISKSYPCLKKNIFRIVLYLSWTKMISFVHTEYELPLLFFFKVSIFIKCIIGILILR